MIPKKIHYCWFGRNPKPKLAEKCIKSWQKYCPDYEIIQWDEDNYDLSAAPLYVRQAYEAKKWAFVTDYVRLEVVHEHGGIYMDTDVELKKNLDFLLGHRAYFGFEDRRFINTGLGFGAEKGAEILREMMNDYLDAPFLLSDGSYDMVPCTRRNTQALLHHGLVQNNTRQTLAEDILVLPSIYLCPIDGETRVRSQSPETVSIHWFDASWMSEEERTSTEAYVKEQKIARYKGKVREIIGDRLYRIIKKIVKRGWEENAEG